MCSSDWVDHQKRGLRFEGRALEALNPKKHLETKWNRHEEDWDYLSGSSYSPHSKALEKASDREWDAYNSSLKKKYSAEMARRKETTIMAQPVSGDKNRQRVISKKAGETEETTGTILGA